VLEDCCAAFNESDHQAAIEVVLAEDGVIGWITCSTEFLQAFNPIEPC
jgi:nicotinamidase-related amidase